MTVNDDFGDLMGILAVPMVIVTVASAGEHAGCLAGFWTQASIDPARLLVHLSKANRTYRMAADCDFLLVHFLHVGNMDLARLFGEQTGDEIDKFSRCSWHEGPARTPVLSGTLGWVGGPVVDRFDSGDHVGHLLDVEVVSPPPSTLGDPGQLLTSQSVRDFDAGHPA